MGTSSGTLVGHFQVNLVTMTVEQVVWVEIATKLRRRASERRLFCLYCGVVKKVPCEFKVSASGHTKFSGPLRGGMSVHTSPKTGIGDAGEGRGTCRLVLLLATSN